MGEKGNLGLDEATMDLAAEDPLSSLDSLPLDVVRSSPETLNAWFDTYLKYREVRELRKANQATAKAAEASAAAAESSANAAASAASQAEGSDPAQQG